MKSLLSELRQEARFLSTKSVGPIDFDYRKRTKVERLLFLVTKEFCKTQFSYDLGGMSYNHQKDFFEFAKTNFILSEDTKIPKEAFEICELIIELSSSDPYAREEAMIELGSSIIEIFRNLTARIIKFIDAVSVYY